MVVVAGECEVGVEASALSSMSAMRRSIMRDREEGKRYREMAAGVQHSCCLVSEVLRKNTRTKKKRTGQKRKPAADADVLSKILALDCR